MKLPRGFGKNYFSLNAITATSSALTLHKSTTRVQKNHLIGAVREQTVTEFEELEECDPACFVEHISDKACHCNCFFLNKTKKTLRHFNTPKQDFSFYAILNRDISPP